MSWQEYVDDHLVAAGFMYAAIVGHDGSPWASTKGFVVQEDEAKNLAKLLTGETSLDGIAENGFFVAGQKYAFTRGEIDDDEGAAPFVQGRCKDEGKSSQGIIIMGTAQAMIVGVHDPKYSSGASFGKVNTDIGRVADYIIEAGY